MNLQTLEIFQANTHMRAQYSGAYDYMTKGLRITHGILDFFIFLAQKISFG